MKNDSLLTRLQAANPEPLIVQTDSFDLFNRITGEPGDPRLSAPARRPLIRRRGLALAVAFAVAALLASTAFAISRIIADDVVGPDVTQAEYLAAQSQLELPPGATWPHIGFGPSNSVTGRGAGGGMAVLNAQNAWECYWVRAIRTGDGAAQARAHAALNALLANNILEAPAGAPENYRPANPPKVPYAVFAHDGGLDRIKASYAAAAEGHPKNLRDSCYANAPSTIPGK
ncbi:MAG TPA: hypothetical protein VKC65_09235 [Gaiellaceae bacterium]|nr:hypothetical protein [Gaiellaceae bacterium]